jgi:hypothetical protein
MEVMGSTTRLAGQRAKRSRGSVPPSVPWNGPEKRTWLMRDVEGQVVHGDRSEVLGHPLKAHVDVRHAPPLTPTKRAFTRYNERGIMPRSRAHVDPAGTTGFVDVRNESQLLRSGRPASGTCPEDGLAGGRTLRAPGSGYRGAAGQRGGSLDVSAPIVNGVGPTLARRGVPRRRVSSDGQV